MSSSMVRPISQLANIDSAIRPIWLQSEIDTIMSNRHANLNPPCFLRFQDWLGLSFLKGSVLSL